MQRLTTAQVSAKLHLPLKEYKVESLITIKKPCQHFCVTPGGRFGIAYIDKNELKIEFLTLESFINREEIKATSDLLILAVAEGTSALVCQLSRSFPLDNNPIITNGQILQTTFVEEKNDIEVTYLRKTFNDTPSIMFLLNLDSKLYAHNDEGNVIIRSKESDSIVYRIYTNKKSAYPSAKLADNRIIVTTVNTLDKYETLFQIWSLGERKPDIEFDWQMTSQPLVLSDGRIVIGLADRVLIGTPSKSTFSSEFLKDNKVGEVYKPASCFLEFPDGDLACARLGRFEIWNLATKELIFSAALPEELVQSMHLIEKDKIIFKTMNNLFVLKLNFLALILNKSAESENEEWEELNKVANDSDAIAAIDETVRHDDLATVVRPGGVVI